MMSALDSCRWVRTQLPRFLDGELAADLAGRVSAHLDRCSGCQGELADERDLLIDTLATLVPAEPPAGLVDAVMAQIDELPVETADPVTSVTSPTFEPGFSESGIVEARDPRAFRLPSFVPGLAAAALLAFVVWAISGENGGGALPIESGNSFASLEQGSTAPGSTADLGTAISESDALYGAASPGVGPAGSGSIQLVRFDVNADEQFDQRDLDALNRHITEGTAIACPAAADIDEDGRITPQDSIRALQHFSVGDSEVFAAVGRTVEYQAGGPLHCAYQACP